MGILWNKGNMRLHDIDMTVHAHKKKISHACAKGPRNRTITIFKHG